MTLSNPFDSNRVQFLTPDAKATPLLVSSRAVQNEVSINRGICDATFVDIKVGESSQRFVKKVADEHALMNEYLCSILCDALGFSFVPKTYFCRNEAWEFFTLQTFVPGMKCHSDLWGQKLEAWEDKANRQLLTDCHLFDYLVNNHDRHGGNFLINADNGEFAAIDHHITFVSFGGFPLCCYRDTIDTSRYITEFVQRLNRVDLLPFKACLRERDFLAFVERIKHLGKFAFQSMNTFMWHAH